MAKAIFFISGNRIIKFRKFDYKVQFSPYPGFRENDYKVKVSQIHRNSGCRIWTKMVQYPVKLKYLTWT